MKTKKQQTPMSREEFRRELELLVARAKQSNHWRDVADELRSAHDYLHQYFAMTSPLF
jgi:hypothetical protein